MKTQKNQLKNKYNHVISQIKDKLSLNQIYRSFQLISNLNKHLSIKLHIFQQLQPLRTLTKEEILNVVSSISFLKYSKKKIAHEEHQFVQLVYPNDHKTLLITGIQEKYIQQMLLQFNQFTLHKRNIEPSNEKFHFAKIISNNGFWVSVQTLSEDIAFHLKKFLRNYKKAMDQNELSPQYRIERRRIRIIILKEDLFTLLIDAMTQIKAETFARHFQHPLHLERRKSLDFPYIQQPEENKSNIIYRPLLAHLYQHHARSELKEEEYSDGFSQSNSLNSDILDSNKMKDLIETSEQGIQAQHYEEATLLYSANANKSQPASQGNSPQKQELICKEDERSCSKQFSIHGSSDSKVQKLSLVRKEVLAFEREKFQIISEGEEGYDVQNYLGKSKDDPFIRIPKPQPPSNNYSTAIQTHQKIFSELSFLIMKRLYSEFKRSKRSKQLIELPEWVKSRSEEERSRHRFYESLCRPNKIIQKRTFLE